MRRQGMEDKSPKRGRKSNTRKTVRTTCAEWKISPRRGDGKQESCFVYSDITEWKISPRRGDGKEKQSLSVKRDWLGMEDKSPKRGRKVYLNGL